MSKTNSIQEITNEWISSKSESSFKEVMKRLTPGMQKHISDVEKNPDRRTEILNDSFSKIWAKIDQYDPSIGAFSSWAYKIVRNEALISKRYVDRIRSLDEHPDDSSSYNYKNSYKYCTLPNDNFDTKISDTVIDELYDCAIDTIRNFPEHGKYSKWKTALILREIEGKQFNEIAEIMNEKESTVKGWVCKARRYLATILETSNPKLVDDYKKLKYINEN